MPAPLSKALGGEEGEDGWIEELEEDQEGVREEGQEVTVEEVERVDEWVEDRDENDEGEGKGKELCEKKKTSPPPKDRPTADACKERGGPAAWVGLASC